MSKGPESIPQLSTNTTLQSLHPHLPLSIPAVPPFLRLFPFFSLHFLLHSCTLSLLLSCPSLSLSLTLNFSSPSSSSPSADRRREGAEFVKRDGQMYRQRKADRGRSGQRSRSGHVWTVSERGVMKEKEGLCHRLCAEREGEQTSLTKESGGDGDEEAGREVEWEKETKNTGGSEVERDLVPVWQPCFFYTSSVGSPLHGNPFDLGQCVTDREDCVCACVWVCVCVCVCVWTDTVCLNHYLSYIYSVHLLQQAYHMLYHKLLLTFQSRCAIWARRQNSPAAPQMDGQLSLSIWQWEADCKHLENVLSLPLSFSCWSLS